MIVISLNNRRLQRFLKDKKGVFSVANADEKNLCLPEFLRFLKKRDIFDTTQKFRDVYLRTYLNLIDELTVSNQSRYWWAYYVSSKNRHRSKFFDDLYAFAAIISLLERFGDKNIIILNPPISIVRSLSRYLKQKKNRTKVLAARMFGGYHNELFTDALFVFDASVRLIFHLTRMVLSKILLSRKFKRAIKDHRGYYVFRSWFNNRSFPKDGRYRDSFFGELSESLQKQEKPVLIAVGMFGVKFRKALWPIAGISNHAVFPLEFFLSPTDLFRAVFRTISSRIRIKRDIYLYESVDIYDIINYQLNIDFCHSVFQNMLNFYIAKNIARRLKIAHFFLTSENNPWEKMTIQAIREYSPGTGIVGFQHTIVSLAKINMMLGDYCKKAMPLPDYIVTSGKVTRDILIEVGGYPPEMVRIGCALRFEKTFNFNLRSRRESNGAVFLVPLEGVNESAGLINFVVETLQGKAKYKVVIRPHPVLPLKRMRQYLTFNPERLPDNFSVSNKKDVVEDLLAADFLLYDSSTVCLEALAMGVPSVYIDLKRPVNYDPLFGCAYLKRSAGSAKEIDESVGFFRTLPVEKFSRQQEAAREYVRGYFYPVNEQNLQAFVR